MRLQQICITLPKHVIKKMEEIRDLTNLPIVNQIKIVLCGYCIRRISDGEVILGSASFED